MRAPARHPRRPRARRRPRRASRDGALDRPRRSRARLQRRRDAGPRAGAPSARRGPRNARRVPSGRPARGARRERGPRGRAARVRAQPRSRRGLPAARARARAPARRRPLPHRARLLARAVRPARGAGAYVRWLYRNADAVIAISGAVRDALVARGVDPAAIAVVPSGVEVERFRPPEGAAVAARAELRIAPERAVIAAVGSLHARKGHAILLRALARLASRRLRPLCLVAGAGPEVQGLLDLARDLGLAERVHWLGRLDDVRPLLWAADVVAMPSLAEGLGVAAIEAMAAGRAVVASAVGGLGELVRDRVDGLLVPPADDIALADALARCLEDGELRDRLGKAAVARAGEYSVAAMARGTEAVYERVRERRAEGAPR